ncbi:DUF3703 domain-containing protein [Qipengyuania sp. MTN3-11]|uniref:DUF3703 domain-containing protein n=1 Tax=Qipengyuania sp. MTN3-11 TaxID=3056557 RepID=UPI0036F36887
MADVSPHRLAVLLAEEYRAADEAERAGRIAMAWHHLERAHILAQTRFWPHLETHSKMLRLALRRRDWREVVGQLFRLALAPLGNLTGRLPLGNTGRSNVSVFAPMELPPDLHAILDPHAD